MTSCNWHSDPVQGFYGSLNGTQITNDFVFDNNGDISEPSYTPSLQYQYYECSQALTIFHLKILIIELVVNVFLLNVYHEFHSTQLVKLHSKFYVGR